MSWINKQKLLATETIKFNGQLCLELNNLWQALYFTFNTVQHCSIESDILNELGSFVSSPWALLLEKEFTNSLFKCSNMSTPGLNKLLWRHLKIILKDKMCLKNIITIANTCIELGYWPLHFKISMTIVIPKPNKSSYDSPKLFRPIVLLNTMGKLIKKFISNRLQFHMIANNFIYHSQLGGLKLKSTTDAGITLTHFIYMRWIKYISTSILVFNIVQFFPSLNHHLLSLILKKASVNSHIVRFFSNYLVNRRTQYVWNNFSSHFVDINMGVGQGLALSPILSTLYLAFFLHILENYLKNLNLQVSLLSFVDDGLLITQSKSFETSNSRFYYSYNVAFNLPTKFNFLVEYTKTEVFYFSRSQEFFNPPPLDLSSISGPILSPKDS